MALLVEIHVPLAEPGEAPGPEHPSVWIDKIEDFLIELADELGFEVFDDGEEYGDVYIFFIAGAGRAVLLAAASRVAALQGVPAGAFVMVTDDEAGEFGMGQKVALPVS